MKHTRLFSLTVVALAIATQSPGRAPDTPPATKKAAPAPEDDDGPCQAILKFAADRLGTLPKGKDLGLHFSCELPSDQPLNFLIAAVPDPIATHLQLWFDRS